MNAERLPAERRVLLLAPTARDARESRSVFSAAGIDCALCDGLDSLCAEIAVGAAAVLVPEEALHADDEERLAAALARQPVWSDLPVVVLSRAGIETPAVARALATLGNVSLLERPVRVSTLISMVKTAMRARERQYQLRDLLANEREARSEADAANRAKDRFLAVLSHELRTPLSPVVMTLASMEEDPGLPAALREEVSMIRRNIDLETKLIDDLLDLSRVTSGKLRLQKQPTNVHQVLRHVHEVCASDLAAKGITLTWELGAGNDRVTADPARLEQVFWNLLKNAVKFTPREGSIVVRTADSDGARIAVEVRDSGIGIAPEALPRIFDAFEQEQAELPWQSGLGLGLAISKAVVDLHGGLIRAASDGRGQGACFTVELPTLSAAPAAEGPAHGPFETHLDAGKPRLLVVDDHADTLRVMAQLLRAAGYRVETAASVAEALEAAGRGEFDLLVSDIGLPDASGYDLMRRLSELYGVPGIALSGYGMEEDVRRSHEAGFLDHVVKPVNPSELKAVIERSLAAVRR